MAEFANESFYRVYGKSPLVGTGGRIFTYTVFVQRDCGLKPKVVARRIDATLADPRGWIRSGQVMFQRVETGATTEIIVAMPEQVEILCQPLDTQGEVSCCVGSRVVLNVERWKEAVPHWTGGIRSYRQMVINHEMGHRIGHSHGYCPGPGRKAPVMQQQTYGLQGCVANSWPLDSEL